MGVDILILSTSAKAFDALKLCAHFRMTEATRSISMLLVCDQSDQAKAGRGLEIGANDVIFSPVDRQELLARVRAQLRRQTLPAADELNLGPLHLHPAERRASVEGQELRLTGAEFALLLTLAQHAGEVVGKATLTRLALGREIERFDRSVDVHVSRLRRKLAEASASAPAIEAVRGAGYLLIAQRP